MHLLTVESRFLIRRFYSYMTVFTVLFNSKKKVLKNSLELSSKPGKWPLPIQEEPVYLILLTKLYADIYTFSIRVKGRFKEKFKF